MKRISKEVASTKYGILLGHYPLNYYLTNDGFVVDSDGDVRYIPDTINTDDELQKKLENIKKEMKKH